MKLKKTLFAGIAAVVSAGTYWAAILHQLKKIGQQNPFPWLFLLQPVDQLTQSHA